MTADIQTAIGSMICLRALARGCLSGCTERVTVKKIRPADG